MVLEDAYSNKEPVAGCVTAVVTVDTSPVIDVGGCSVHILTR